MYRSTARPTVAGFDRSPGRTQQVPRRHRRVEDVVGVAHAVAVAVLAPVRPRPRQELHRPDGPIPHGVAVPLAAVTVPYHRRPRHRPVEHGTRDPAPGVPLLVDAAAVDVPGLDPPDAGEKPPTEVTGRLRGGKDGLRLPVCGEDGHRDAGGSVGRSRRPGQRHRGLRLDGRGVDRRARGTVDLGSRGRADHRRTGRRSGHEGAPRRSLVDDGRRVDLGAGGEQHGRRRRRRRGRGPSRKRGRVGRPAATSDTEAADEEDRQQHRPGGPGRRHSVGKSRARGPPARRPRGPARSAQPTPAFG